jgi:hypothetical protein
MASQTGGQWVFGLGANDTTDKALQLSTNNGTSFFPNPVSGDLNIEVFVASSIIGTLDTGFQAGAADKGASVVNGLLTGSPLLLGGGDYVVSDTVVGSHTPGAVTAGSGNQTLVGASGDALTGGSGNKQVLSGIAGNEFITGGTGTYSVYGATGDTIVGNAAATAATAGVIIGQDSLGGGNMSIVLPAAGTYFIGSGPGDTITAAAGSGNAAIFGVKGDSINLAGNTGNVAVVGAGVIPGFSAGGDTITGGSGNDLLFGAAGDSLVGGAGGLEQIIATGAAMVVGSGGTEFMSGLGNDVITALASGNATVVASLGAKDSINLSGNLSANEIIASGANATITVASISNPGGVIGGANTLITLGTSGTDNITGSSVTGSGDTIKGSSGANLVYNPGATGTTTSGGDFINLTGSTGSDTVNAFSNGSTQFGAVGDTVIAGNGSDSVFGGPNDRIGVGSVSGAGTVGGSHLWLHASSVTGAGSGVAFGTNDSVAGSSTAKVTIGAAGQPAVDFNTTTDSLFYQNENSVTTTAILATAQTTGGNTTFTMPDGTVMTLIGVASIKAGFFKP